MTRPDPVPAARSPRFADAFVILSVTILSLTSGAWLLAQQRVELWSAMTAALTVYCSLLAVHLVVRRFFAGSRLDVGASPEGIEWRTGQDHGDAVVGARPPRREQAAKVDASQPAAPRPKVPVWADTPAPQPKAPPAPPPLPRGDGSPPLPKAEGPPPLPRSQQLPMPPPGEPFHYRPARPPSLGQPSAAPQRAQARPAEPSKDQQQAVPAAGPSEKNVEYIQELIRKLADELNNTPPPERAGQSQAAGHADAMLGRSVAALEATARTMRSKAADPAGAGRRRASAAGPAPQSASPDAAKPARANDSRPSAPPPVDPQLARIAEAVAAERMEVLLEPIHALAEGRARHFEVSVRLLTADGIALEQSEFARAAQGSGLMPRIDAARIVRAVRVARRLGERGRQGSVFTAVAGESLTNATFREAATVQPGSEEPMSLVLSFAQSEARVFTPGHIEVLRAMKAAGFSFALEDVTDLDTDFSSLKSLGFEFVKLDAPVFLDGLPAAGGRVPASDICRHLSDFGLTLIVGRIEDDWLLARVLGFGVLFGKGTLFGGPKLVKADVVQQSAAA